MGMTDHDGKQDALHYKAEAKLAQARLALRQN